MSLDLGWVQFKWRNAMPDIGRFFNVDPISEKYYYNSVYAFSENKVTAHVELEGLESSYGPLNQAIKNVENVVMPPVNAAKEGLSDALEWVGDKLTFVDNMEKEPEGKDKPAQKGIGINFNDPGKGGPDNKYVPSPDPNSKNFDMDKSLLDALNAISESPSAPTPKNFVEKIETIAGGVEKTVGAVQAGTDAAKNWSGHQLDTLYGTAEYPGATANYYIVIQDGDTIQQPHHLPKDIPAGAKKIQSNP